MIIIISQYRSLHCIIKCTHRFLKFSILFENITSKSVCFFYPLKKRKRTPKGQPKMANTEKHTVHRTQYYYKSQQKHKQKKDKQKTSVTVLNEHILILFVVHVVIFGIVFIHFACVSLLCFI